MILVCPSCAATHSAEAWVSDAAIRETLAAVVKLPKPVQEQLWPYLALFRPPSRALSWARARRLVGDLAKLVAAGRVSWEKEADRPCTPALWAQGMAEMAARKGGFKSHFSNHNYLRKIVYDLADKADAGRERQTREAERAHQRSAAAPDPAPEAEPDTPEAAANRRQFFSALEQLAAAKAMPGTEKR